MYVGIYVPLKSTEKKQFKDKAIFCRYVLYIRLNEGAEYSFYLP